MNYQLKKGRGIYLYVLEGGSLMVNGHQILTLGAAKILDEVDINLKAENETEILLVDVLLI